MSLKNLKILALDTSTDACSVAYCSCNDDKKNDVNVIAEYFDVIPKQHSLLILEKIKKILAECEASLENLDFIAFAHGPGSFTGIRLAASVVQGLAMPYDLPIASVSTLQAMAQGAYEEYKVENILVGLDARVNEIYFGVYQVDAKGYVLPIKDDQLIKPEEAKISANWNGKKVLSVGNAWKVYGEILQERCKVFTIETTKEDFYPRARYIAKLGMKLYQERKLILATEALPIYLRDEVAKTEDRGQMTADR